MARTLTALAVLLVCAGAAGHAPCRVLDTTTRYTVSTDGYRLTEYYELREVWVPGYFVCQPVLVSIVHDTWGNVYPIWENRQVWVPGYFDRGWVLVWVR